MDAHPHLQLKTRPKFSPVSQSLSMLSILLDSFVSPWLWLVQKRVCDAKVALETHLFYLLKGRVANAAYYCGEMLGTDIISRY
jgi:hypothetical protein